MFAIYALLPAVALSALPVRCNAAGKCQTLLGVPEDQGRLRRRSGARDRQAPDLGPFQHAGEIYVGLLAATILFIATNAGIIGVSRLVYSMGLHRQVPEQLRQLHPKLPHAVDRDPRVRGDRMPHADPGSGRLPGQHVRVRRDAVVHDRPHLGDPPADQVSGRERPYRGPGTLRVAGYRLPLFAVLGGIGTGFAWVTVTSCT